MAIITFWSNMKKTTGQTMSMAAIATNMAIEHNYKILMISTRFNDNALELCFGETDKNRKILRTIIKTDNIAVDTGIQGISKLAKSGRLSPEIIQNYTQIIYKNRLEVLYGYKNTADGTGKDEYLNMRDKYREIIQNASKSYDMVFVDIGKGLDDEINRKILSISDVVVVTVEQKIEMINDFIELKNKYSKASKDNMILNIGRFDTYSKYSVKNIARYTGVKRNISVIPYNTLYFEASNEQKVAELFLKIRNVEETDRNGMFMKAVREAVQILIYKLQELQMRM
ncbi:MAG: hypothetical protein HFJ53_06430 [Clostridia bacterium]|nr:hypothetical protein [Clostridia bacterium]